MNANQQAQYEIAKNAIEKLLMECWTFYDDQKRKDQPYTWIDRLRTDIEKIDRKLKNQKFQVAVMALMKSGKSTLLNAWIGEEYLPSASDAETVQVIRIEHDEHKIEGQLFSPKNEVLAHSSEKVRETIRTINEKGRKNKEFIDEELTLQVSLSSIKGKFQENILFTILDTPGTNEKLPIVEESVKQLINTVDVVIYLMDFTKLDFENETKILDNLKQLRNTLVTDKNRLFFVINKIDELDRNDKEKGLNSEEDIVKLVKERYLKKENFHQHTIIPVSAKRALLARLMLSNKAEKSQKEDFYIKAFGEEFDREDLTPKMIEKAANSQFKKSGFEHLEKEILQVLFEKGNTILLKSVIEDIERCFKQVFNDLSIEKGGLETKEVDIQRTINQVNDIRKKLEVLNTDDTFKKKVEDIVEKGFQTFEDNITEMITTEFSNNKFRQYSSFDFIKSRFPNFFKPNINIEFENQEHLEQVMKQLNFDISTAMQKEFDSYWTPTIKEIYAEYKKFAKNLEKKIEPAIREIEDVIKKGLNISLYDYEISNIWVEQFEFFNNLTQGTNNLAKANKGWRLSWWYFIPYPERYVKNYTLNTNDYIDFLCKNAEDLIDAHILHIYKILEEQLGVMFDMAKNQVFDYANEYENAMNTVIKQKQGGEEHISQRIEIVHEDINICKKILLEAECIDIEGNSKEHIEGNDGTVKNIFNIDTINNANFNKL